MTNDAAGGPGPASTPSAGYRYYVLAVVTLIYLVAFLDRSVLAVLLPQIKESFALSDFALSLLVGPAFAIVYSFLGVPIALAGDRFNRRNIVGASVAIFSAATLLSGFAVQFWHLLAARLGVGIGQAGTSPSINSMLSDLFPPQKRAAVFAIYTMGANLGVLTLFGIGVVASSAGWQTAIIVAGIPGILLALLTFATVREPERGAQDKTASTPLPSSVANSCSFLLRSATYRNLSLGMMCVSAGGYAFSTFFPTFLYRSHGLAIDEAAMVFALLYGGLSAAGTFVGGLATERASRRAIGRALTVPAWMMLLSVPFIPFILLAPSSGAVIAAALVPAFLNAAHIGPSYAAVQGVAPQRMRAVAAAVFLFIINIVGLGIGPLLIGAISDALTPAFGVDSLRYALLVHVAALVLGAWFFWRASASYGGDIDRATAA